MGSRPFSFSLALGLICTLTACGIWADPRSIYSSPSSTTTGSSCTNGIAQLDVSTNGVIRVCGCLESSGASFGRSSTGFVCTVSLNTTIVFNFSDSQQHVETIGSATIAQQNYPTDSEDFAANGVGTFAFYDSISGVSGHIIINP